MGGAEALLTETVPEAVLRLELGSFANDDVAAALLAETVNDAETAPPLKDTEVLGAV